jgi:hypothetical protein
MSVYLAAHQDDWQLFMDPLVSADLTDPLCKTIILHTTAGDAGRSESYWKARETASVGSLHFRLAESGPVPHTDEPAEILKKRVQRHIIGNARIYFFRLPDGNIDGNGFQLNGNSSMEKLKQGAIKNLVTVDRRSVFGSFDELCCLVTDLILQEAGESGVLMKNVVLNYPEYDEGLSPDDHSDHYATGHLGERVLAGKECTRRIFIHYAMLNHESVLAGEDLFWKVGMLAVYHQSIFRECGYSTLGERSFYRQWCLRHPIYRTKIQRNETYSLIESGPFQY